MIKLSLSNNQNLFIIAAYAAISINNEFFPELNKIFESLKLSNLNNFYILAGDMNAKHNNWGNIVSNSRGRALNNWIINKSFEYRVKLLKPDQPTFPRTNSFLDIMLVDARLNLLYDTLNIIKTLEYDSDHWAIQAEFILLENPYVFETKTPSPIFLYKKTNWIKFREFMESRPIPPLSNKTNLTNQQIEEGLDNLNQIIKESIEKTVPKLKFQNSMNVPNNLNPT